MDLDYTTASVFKMMRMLLTVTFTENALLVYDQIDILTASILDEKIHTNPTR